MALAPEAWGSSAAHAVTSDIAPTATQAGERSRSTQRALSGRTLRKADVIVADIPEPPKRLLNRRGFSHAGGLEVCHAVIEVRRDLS